MTPATPQFPQDATAALFADVRAGIPISAILRNRALDPVDVRILLEYALGMSHVQLVTQSERLLNDEEARKVAELLERRHRGEPVAHIVGWREFYGLPFLITPDVLIPRPETELLVELAIARLPANGSLLDLGTGSGAIAVAVAHERPDVLITATDVSPAALEVAKENARRHLAAEREIRFYLGNWFAALPGPCCFDLIVSNPPYIVAGDMHLSQGDLRHEPQGALTDFADGLTAFRELTAHASGWLVKNGWLLVEHGYDQAQAVRELLLANGFASVQSWNDLAGIERVSGGIFPG